LSENKKGRLPYLSKAEKSTRRNTDWILVFVLRHTTFISPRPKKNNMC